MGTTLTSFDYAYDAAGNRTSVLDWNRTRVTWTYDKLDQLASEASTLLGGTFTPYRVTHSYDAANQLETAKEVIAPSIPATTTYT